MAEDKALTWPRLPCAAVPTIVATRCVPRGKGWVKGGAMSERHREVFAEGQRPEDAVE